MADHVFDPHFSTKIKLLFSQKFQIVQKDSALRGLELVYKDQTFADFAIQCKPEDVDRDLLEEIRMQKKDIQRLNAELVAVHSNLKMNDKTVKRAKKEVSDAKAESKSFEKALSDSRGDWNKQQTTISQYKVIQQRLNQEIEVFQSQLAKQRHELEKKIKADKMAEKVIDKMNVVTTRQNVLIQDQDKILGQLEPLATDDIMKAIQSVKDLKKKVDKTG